MYHRIRIAAVSLVAMTFCMLSSSGTLSYFTDTDSVINNFVVGNASTVLAIYDDVNGGEEHLYVHNDTTIVDQYDAEFYPEATNDGNIPVYQRFRVVIPIVLADVVTLNLPAMNDDCIITTTSKNTCSNEDYTVKYNPSVNNTDAVYYIVSNKPIKVGETTKKWPMTGVHFGDISKIDKSVFACEDDSGNSCVLGISIYSDAVQTAGFANAASAFAE